MAVARHRHPFAVQLSFLRTFLLGCEGADLDSVVRRNFAFFPMLVGFVARSSFKIRNLLKSHPQKQAIGSSWIGRVFGGSRI
jgi:hypothetical protein